MARCFITLSRPAMMNYEFGRENTSPLIFTGLEKFLKPDFFFFVDVRPFVGWGAKKQSLFAGWMLMCTLCDFEDIGGFLMRGLRPLSKKPYVILS